MVILIVGATHSGKTLTAQKLLEKLSYPYLSIDHLKMGLIRSGHCQLTAESGDSDSELTAYLWPIVRDMIKTVIENDQHLIVEGCYIPPDYYKDFPEEYLRKIRYVGLIFSEKYIHAHYEDILMHAKIIENRRSDARPPKDSLIRENRRILNECRENGLNYVLINDLYDFHWETLLRFIAPDGQTS